MWSPSRHDTWFLVQTSTSLELVGTAFSFVTGSVGEGAFTVASDRAKLGPVMQTIVRQKLRLSLQEGDLPGYRRHLNLQAVHLRDLGVEHVKVADLGLHFEADVEDVCAGDVVASFLQQNGLAAVTAKDAAGWWPLHYAALSGNLEDQMNP